MNAFSGLRFHDDPTVNAKIDLQVVLDSPTAIDNGNSNLNFHRESAHPQLDHQAVAIHGFEKPRSQCAVNGHRGTDDDLGQLVKGQLTNLHANHDEHEPGLPTGGAF